MYGALSYGQVPYGSTATSGGVYLVGDIALDPVASITAAHGIGGSATIEVPNLVVQIGADQVERVATVVVEAGISFSATSTIPTYAVGLVAPTVSVSSMAWTTVRGTAGIVIPVNMTVLCSQNMPMVASIVAKVRVSATASVFPTVTAAIRPVVSVSGSGLVVTHGRGAVTIPTYVSSAVITGFVGSVSATIRSVFSATAVHQKAASAAITVPVSFSGSLKHGCGIAGVVSPSVVFSATAGAYSDIQISGAVGIPLYPYIRCTFGDDLVNADCAYVMTKQLSVSVLQ
jgi:hypothetical protein